MHTSNLLVLGSWHAEYNYYHCISITWHGSPLLITPNIYTDLKNTTITAFPSPGMAHPYSLPQTFTLISRILLSLHFHHLAWLTPTHYPKHLHWSQEYYYHCISITWHGSPLLITPNIYTDLKNTTITAFPSPGMAHHYSLPQTFALISRILLSLHFHHLAWLTTTHYPKHLHWPQEYYYHCISITWHGSPLLITPNIYTDLKNTTITAFPSPGMTHPYSLPQTFTLISRILSLHFHHLAWLTPTHYPKHLHWSQEYYYHCISITWHGSPLLITPNIYTDLKNTTITAFPSPGMTHPYSLPQTFTLISRILLSLHFHHLAWLTPTHYPKHLHWSQEYYYHCISITWHGSPLLITPNIYTDLKNTTITAFPSPGMAHPYSLPQTFTLISRILLSLHFHHLAWLTPTHYPKHLHWSQEYYYHCISITWHGSPLLITPNIYTDLKNTTITAFPSPGMAHHYSLPQTFALISRILLSLHFHHLAWLTTTHYPKHLHWPQEYYYHCISITWHGSPLLITPNIYTDLKNTTITAFPSPGMTHPYSLPQTFTLISRILSLHFHHLAWLTPTHYPKHLHWSQEYYYHCISITWHGSPLLITPNIYTDLKNTTITAFPSPGMTHPYSLPQTFTLISRILLSLHFHHLAWLTPTHYPKHLHWSQEYYYHCISITWHGSPLLITPNIYTDLKNTTITAFPSPGMAHHYSLPQTFTLISRILLSLHFHHLAWLTPTHYPKHLHWSQEYYYHCISITWHGSPLLITPNIYTDLKNTTITAFPSPGMAHPYSLPQTLTPISRILLSLHFHHLAWLTPTHYPKHLHWSQEYYYHCISITWHGSPLLITPNIYTDLKNTTITAFPSPGMAHHYSLPQTFTLISRILSLHFHHLAWLTTTHYPKIL